MARIDDTQETIPEWFARELAAAVDDGRIKPGNEESRGERALARKILGQGATQSQIKEKARRLRGIGPRPQQQTVDQIAAALEIPAPVVQRGGLEAAVASLERRVTALEVGLAQLQPGQAVSPGSESSP